MATYGKNVRVENQNFYNILKVYYLGTDALSEGEGVCFDRDYDDGTSDGDASEAWGNRCVYVNAPDATNNNSFAGVVVRSYTADAHGQFIEIYLPGSICKVLTTETSLTIGEDNYIWCLAGSSESAGSFAKTIQGFAGKGQARVMQSISAAGLVLCELMEGAESGLIEVIPTDTLTAGGAITIMVGGATYFKGAATPLTDCTQTLANGTYVGQKKYYYLNGALTTNDIEITLATTGEQLNGTTDLAKLEFDGDGDNCMLEWGGKFWQLRNNAGTGLS